MLRLRCVYSLSKYTTLEISVVKNDIQHISRDNVYFYMYLVLAVLSNLHFISIREDRGSVICLHFIFPLCTWPLVSPSIQNLKSHPFSSFQTFLNQYQACLFLFECISHGYSKYSNEDQLFWHFWQILWTFRPVICSTPAAWHAHDQERLPIFRRNLEAFSIDLSPFNLFPLWCQRVGKTSQNSGEIF